MLDQPFKSAKKMCIPVKEMQLLPDLVPVLVADFVVLHLHQTKSAQKRCIYIKRNQQKKRDAPFRSCTKASRFPASKIDRLSTHRNGAMIATSIIAADGADSVQGGYNRYNWNVPAAR
jgi:hypothetical protein